MAWALLRVATTEATTSRTNPDRAMATTGHVRKRIRDSFESTAQDPARHPANAGGGPAPFPPDGRARSSTAVDPVGPDRAPPARRRLANRASSHDRDVLVGLRGVTADADRADDVAAEDDRHPALERRRV